MWTHNSFEILIIPHFFEKHREFFRKFAFWLSKHIDISNFPDSRQHLHYNVNILRILEVIESHTPRDICLIIQIFTNFDIFIDLPTIFLFVCRKKIIPNIIQRRLINFVPIGQTIHRPILQIHEQVVVFLQRVRIGIGVLALPLKVPTTDQAPIHIGIGQANTADLFEVEVEQMPPYRSQIWTWCAIRLRLHLILQQIDQFQFLMLLLARRLRALSATTRRILFRAGQTKNEDESNQESISDEEDLLYASTVGKGQKHWRMIKSMHMCYNNLKSLPNQEKLIFYFDPKYSNEHIHNYLNPHDYYFSTVDIERKNSLVKATVVARNKLLHSITMIHYKSMLVDYCFKPMKFKIMDDKNKNLLNVERTPVACITDLNNSITKAQIKTILEVFGKPDTYYTLYDEMRMLSKGFVVVRFKEATSAVELTAYCDQNDFQERVPMSAALVDSNWLHDDSLTAGMPITATSNFRGTKAPFLHTL